MYSDGTNIYDSHFNILPKADVATFEHISDNWYKDKSHVWWSSKLVAGANPETFQPVPAGGFGGDGLSIRDAGTGDPGESADGGGGSGEPEDGIGYAGSEKNLL